MYQCAIAYTGNDVLLDTALYESITLNGNVVTDQRPLKDMGAIWNRVIYALSTISVTSPLVMVTSNNSGKSDSIAANTGDIFAYVTIFYPSAELTGSIDVTVNGTLEIFTFEKIGTA